MFLNNISIAGIGKFAIMGCTNHGLALTSHKKFIFYLITKTNQVNIVHFYLNIPI